MTGDEARVRGPALPAALRPTSEGAPLLGQELLVEALAGAAATTDVASAVLDPLLRVAGVRAALVAAAPRAGADPVVLASAGYDCTTMSAGAVLPLAAGLPVTECVRTGEVRVVGRGPSWAAVPAGRGAALLVSLVGPPPEGDALAVLARLGRLLEAPLARARAHDDDRDRLAVLEHGLGAPAPAAPGLALRAVPFSGALSGDVVEVVTEDPAGTVRWLLLADVCGRGAAAAVGADRLRAAFRACAPGSPGPAAVLARLDRVLDGGDEAFATALVVRTAPGTVHLASAGHPAPVLSPGGPVVLVPGPPLGLGLADSGPPPTDVVLRPDRVVLLVAATDGVTDRGREVDLDAVVAGLPPGLDVEAAADRVLAACCAEGPAQDDATLLVARLEPGSGS